LAASLAGARAARERQEADVRAAREPWTLLAKTIGASPPGTTASALPFVSGAVGDVPFRLRVVRDEQGWAHTQAFSDALRPVRCEIGVYASPAGFLDWVKSHFEEDIEIGDAPFDRAFVIRARPREVAASMLSHDVRILMTAFLGHALAGLTYKDGTVALQWNGVELDQSVLEHAVQLVTLVATWQP
jgi:hypothetical protein